MAEFTIDFRSSFFHFDVGFNSGARKGFSFSIGTKKSSQKYGWKSFGYNREDGWWKWQQAIPI